jgi:hypothetical protein
LARLAAGAAALTGVRDGICEVSVSGSKSVNCAFRL